MYNKNFTQKITYLIFIGISMANYAFADITSVMTKVGSDILTPIAGLFAALAAIYFIYGIFLYFQSGLNDKELDRAKSHILWGLIGLVIIFSVQGIMNIITSTVTGLN